ncbi:helix-turn-helix domain-containing protein [Desulfogranum mediterraneum]|uniref:helix-turn-helix domain-containing protein n=1 Tax=Desulfogranum mediterraneum TaxID=160661 RepID=UPI00041D26A1|nr:helix-turn-helix domain-containing protein [Desulfogranum mediterraneum]
MEQTNPELQLAAEFIAETDCSIFLTGKAGTGKTTFLQQLTRNPAKRLIVTAPTGVAAINAGGVTLHSFFQLPFGPFVPGSEAHADNRRKRFSKEKQNIIKSLDLLIIDEISMVRADMLDAVDAVLQRYRRSNAPFGGVQLLLIGDLHQLSPVVKESERPLLAQWYPSPYFFASKALAQTRLVTIELQHIYRQSDPVFIELLNGIRDNSIDAQGLERLNRRYLGEQAAPDSQGAITLCTHNRQADALNAEQLRGLPHSSHRFAAEIEGEFPEQAQPTAPLLELKRDAQVMFIRNDPSAEKRFFNGKIGTVIRIDNDSIMVRCPDDEQPIAVKPATWENIQYTLDQEAGEIREKKIGSFAQYPLKLAWAITIHKSQGLTFDRAIIDARAAFTHGQIYVALSRCRSLEGITLSSPLAATTMETDSAVRHFLEQAQAAGLGRSYLEAEKVGYQQRLLLACFDFQQLGLALGQWLGLLSRHGQQLQISGLEDPDGFAAPVREELCTVGANFLRQLQGLFQESLPPARDPLILERLSKASAYFQDKLASRLLTPLGRVRVESDNRELSKRLEQALQRLEGEGVVKLAAVSSCGQGFSPEQYLRSISRAEIQAAARKKTRKEKAPLYTVDDVAHPQLFADLQQWRTDKAREEGRAPYQVLHLKTLVQLAVHLPISLAGLKEVKGIGERLAQRYGRELIEMVREYRREHGVDEVVLPVPVQQSLEQSLVEAGAGGGGVKPAKKGEQTGKPAKGRTREISLELFEQGLSVAEIAEQRSLVPSTIEGHLAFFVEQGRLDVGRLVGAERLEAIQAALEAVGEQGFGRVREQLGGDYSYGEIKLVQAHLKQPQPQPPEAASAGSDD